MKTQPRGNVALQDLTPLHLRQLLLNVGLGFSITMLLLLGMIVLSVTQVAEVNKQLEKVVTINNVKTRLATHMRDSLRDRAIIMHDIVVSIDPWEKDDLFQEFLLLGQRYAKDRNQLIEMQDSGDEKKLLAKVDEITRVNQPVMFDVVSAAMDQNNYGALTMLQQQAIPLQKKLVAALDDMTQLQREANELALKNAYQAYIATRSFILVLGTIAVLLVAAVAVTVSRKVLTQTRLLDAEKLKFQTLFESNSDAVVILGDSGFIDCNPATLQMFRMQSVEEFLRTPIASLGAPLQNNGQTALQYALKYIIQAQQEGHAFMEWTGQRADGSLFPSEIALHAMQLGGKPVIQAIMRDISERKEVDAALRAAHDEALAAAKAKGEFIANVSHEIRTPMHGIMGMSDLLLREPLTGSQREYAITLRQSSQGLLNVINDILDFSKIEAGKLSLEHIPYRPTQVLQSVADLYQPRALEKSLTLDTQFSPELQSAVLGDPHRLRQILLNLIDNAIKFTSRGHIHIKARALDERWLRIEVQDEGIGIAADVQARIFSAFSQADASTTRKFGGTGLGLAICSQLVELMQGRIGVISPPPGAGQGSLFWLELPLEPAPAGLETTLLQHPRIERFSGRVLIAEDNPVNQKVLSYQLTALGLQTDIASTGRLAIDKALAAPWDMILMDWQMPEMDGLEAARAIRSLPGKVGQIPIIALTAQSSKDFREQCMAAGMNDYLTKPYEEAALISVLARWLPGAVIDMPPPLDLDKLATRHRPEFLHEMTRIFLETTEISLDKLQTALEDRDVTQGKHEAHSLRGAAAAISADVLLQSATLLESAFIQDNWAEAEALIEDLQAEYLRLRNFLGTNSLGTGIS